MMPPIVRLLACDLGCARGGRLIFSSLNFAVSAGEALAVTGPNGVGKSSLLRLIAGLLSPAQGHVTVEGGDSELSIAQQTHYLGHRDPFKPSLTVHENLSFWTEFLGGAGEIAGALETVGLAGIAHLPAGYLSAGQRRRLSIARLTAIDRPIWLLDEPAAGLDVSGQAMLLAMMKRHIACNGIILAATHGPLGLPSTRELQLGATP